MYNKLFLFLILATLVSNTYGQKKINYWAVKTNILEYMNGTYSVYFEKNISDLFGVEVSAGLTGKNFIYSELSNPDINNSDGKFLWSESSSDPNYILNNNNYFYYYYRDFKYGLGFSASICPRIYFLNDPSEGSFMGIRFMYKYFNIESLSEDNSYKSMNISRLNTTLQFGRKLAFSDNFALEYFVDAGISTISEPKNVRYYDANNPNSGSDGKIYWSPFRFHGSIGLALTFMKF